MIYTLTLNPAMDKTLTVPAFSVDAVNRVETVRADAGGKGVNVSRWVRALGGKSVAIGIAGGDTGQCVIATLAKEGIDSDFVLTKQPTRTNIKVIDPERGTHTDINEPGAAVSAQTLQAVCDRLAARAGAGDIVVLAGRLPPGAPSDLPARWTAALRDRGVRVFIDMDGEAFRRAMKEAPWLVKPNETELSRYAGRPLEALDDIADMARTLVAGGVRYVVVSLGAKGALFVEAARVWYARALTVKIGSTVGAGDATVAALAFAMENGDDFRGAIPLAIAAGAASVMQPGTHPAPLSLVRSLAARVSIEEMHT